jgi:hypothetical protein
MVPVAQGDAGGSCVPARRHKEFTRRRIDRTRPFAIASIRSERRGVCSQTKRWIRSAASTSAAERQAVLAMAA